MGYKWTDRADKDGLVELVAAREEHSAQTRESDTDRALRVLREELGGRDKVMNLIKGTDEAGQEVFQMSGYLKHPTMDTKDLPLMRFLLESLELQPGTDVRAFRDGSNVTVTVSAERLREKLPAIQRGGMAQTV